MTLLANRKEKMPLCYDPLCSTHNTVETNGALNAGMAGDLRERIVLARNAKFNEPFSYEEGLIEAWRYVLDKYVEAPDKRLSTRRKNQTKSRLTNET